MNQSANLRILGDYDKCKKFRKYLWEIWKGFFENAFKRHKSLLKNSKIRVIFAILWLSNSIQKGQIYATLHYILNQTSSFAVFM